MRRGCAAQVAAATAPIPGAGTTITATAMVRSAAAIEAVQATTSANPLVSPGPSRQEHGWQPAAPIGGRRTVGTTGAACNAGGLRPRNDGRPLGDGSPFMSAPVRWQRIQGRGAGSRAHGGLPSVRLVRRLSRMVGGTALTGSSVPTIDPTRRTAIAGCPAMASVAAHRQPARAM